MFASTSYEKELLQNKIIIRKLKAYLDNRYERKKLYVRYKLEMVFSHVLILECLTHELHSSVKIVAKLAILRKTGHVNNTPYPFFEDSSCVSYRTAESCARIKDTNGDV